MYIRNLLSVFNKYLNNKICLVPQSSNLFTVAGEERMLQFCIGVVVFLCFLKWLQRRRKFRKIVNGYPGPDYWPIIGNIMDWSNKPGAYLQELFTLI